VHDRDILVRNKFRDEPVLLPGIDVITTAGQGQALGLVTCPEKVIVEARVAVIVFAGIEVQALGKKASAAAALNPDPCLLLQEKLAAAGKKLLWQAIQSIAASSFSTASGRLQYGQRIVLLIKSPIFKPCYRR